MKAVSIKEAWDNYFFKERPVEGIAVLRILLGILALSTFIQDALRLEDFWGPYAIQSFETSMRNYPFPTLNLFQFFKPGYGIVYFFVTVQIIALTAFTLGFKTRIASILSFILMVTFHQRNINMLSSADLLMRILFLYMVFAPSERAFSIDSLIAKFKGKPLKREHASWVHRLIQIQIAVVYVSTVIAKCKGNTWLDGSAVYYSTRLTDFTRFTVPYILDWKWSLMLMTWSTLILELSLGTLIFIDELRKPIIVMGILFHLGIEYMMAVPTFEWIMIIGLIGMFKVDDYRAFSMSFKSWCLDQVNKLKRPSLKSKLEKVIL